MAWRNGGSGGTTPSLNAAGTLTRDGTRVPLSIISEPDAALDGCRLHMSSGRPMVPGRAGVTIAALAILTALAGALLLGHTKAMPQADLRKHAQATGTDAGVQLTTTLSLRQTAP